MPTIGWGTDLHLDHSAPPARGVLAAQIRALQGVPLLLTGDMSVAPSLVAELETVADAAADATVYLVLGNHDHYGASVAQVRDQVTELALRRPRIQWLPPAGVVMLDPETALVGVDGWADGRHGDALHTPLVLNDDRLIAELRARPDRRTKLAVKRALADADAARLGVLLDRAAAAAKRVVVATHVPPFPEALPSAGRVAGADWLPLLVCGATGTVLRRVAAEHPEHDFLVLCGHTHVAHEARIGPNLRCLVGGARYGKPDVRIVMV